MRPADAEATLRAARTGRRTHAPFTDSEPALDEQWGYEVQALDRTHRVECGERPVGAKLVDAFAVEVPRAIEAAGDDPVRRLAAAFAAYCTVIDEHRHAAVLTYRESKSLDAAGRERIKRLEVETSQPLRDAVLSGVESGLLRTAEPDLVAYNLLLLAHAWALKHWYFEKTMTLEAYIGAQLALALSAVITPTSRRKYADLLSPS